MPFPSVTLVSMVALLLGMLTCLALASTVLFLVAVPARREGREMLTERGEAVLSRAKDTVEAKLPSRR